MKSNSNYKMKTISFLLIISLFINGVFGGDAHEVKSVTVMKGKSFTLHIDVNGTRITFEDVAELNTESQSASQLQSDKRCTPMLNLSIKNIATIDSEFCQLDFVINKNRTKSEAQMSVVVESVTEGDSVTLHSLTKLQSKDVTVWRFNVCRIARINSEINSDPVYDSDERFTDRLKMNNQTGDLTITNITSEQTGIYQLEIIKGTLTIKGFGVVVSQRSSTGLSSGWTAGICVFTLVLVIAVAGLIFYCHKRRGREGPIQPQPRASYRAPTEVRE
ncbi:uncharacterized protein LOC130429761 [Triplophysa dalaica]|uniref:uncharacterized protein LOC130429761 n=1 Tax=Triplophysa dalaica TaxID=1582913 RepID=UPI0024E0189C|nr:uncharacterized protein LOC130429761 [Triplophysa dalaica]